MLVRYNVVTGATLAFAARLRPLVLPVAAGWMHDGWVALLAAAVTPAVAIAEPLVGYRQHTDQAQGVPPRTLARQLKLAWTLPRDQFAKEADAYEAVLKRLTMWHLIAGPDDHLTIDLHAIEALQAKVDHLRARSAIRLRQRPRVSTALRELRLQHYRRYSLAWKSFAQDVLL